MEHKIIIVGIGPGDGEYIIPAALKAIASAKVLVGSCRALQTFNSNAEKKQSITGDIKSVMNFIRREHAINDIVVMVSGDPGYYSLLDALRRVFGPADLLVIPGISSAQLAFARLALPWHDAKLLSLHGRKPKHEDFIYEKGAVLGILTDTTYTSWSISEMLLKTGWPENTMVYFCARLSYEDETIVQTTLADAKNYKEFSHFIMVVIA
jgi:cobalt-precorrin-7 (C5)-methyltransferase